MVNIFLIYAENCTHCKDVQTNIENAISKCKKIECKLNKIHFDTQEAISLAIRRGINDLPGVVIGESVFVKNCSEKEIIEAINKAAKS